MDTLLLVLRLGLAAVFIVAALGKLTDRAGTRRAVGEFGVPEVLTGLVGLLLPVAELGIAAALVLTAGAWFGALGAAALLGLFTVAIGLNLALGRTPDCHCFGTLQSEPIGASTIVRNLLLIAMAGFIAVQDEGDTGASATAWIGDLNTLDSIAAGLAALVIALLALTAWLLVDAFARNGQVLVRLDAIDQRLAGLDDGHDHDHGPELPEGLPIGTPAPDFALQTLEAEPVSLTSLMAEAKPVLLVFTDANCGPCHELLPELGRWQREDRHASVAVFSSGDPAAVRKRASKAKLRRVLLDPEGEVADLFESAGTPSAVAIDEQGRVLSQLALGAVQIRALALQLNRTPDSTTSVH